MLLARHEKFGRGGADARRDSAVREAGMHRGKNSEDMIHVK